MRTRGKGKPGAGSGTGSALPLPFVTEDVTPPAIACWRPDTLGGPDAVTVEVDLSSLAERARELVAEGRGHLDVSAEELPLGLATPAIEELDEAVMNGQGIRIVRGFPVDDLAVAELVFWRVGLAIGTPVSQSVLGDRLGHVIDVTDVDPHARAYRRREELSPHTDPGDVLAFLCIRPAAEGGANRFVSSMTLHEELRRDHPELLARHRRGWRHHRFGEEPPGANPITEHRVPTFSVCDGVLSARYLRQYVEIANAEDPDGCPLDEVDRRALETLDALGRDPRFSLEFTLQPGEAVFANNHTVMHSRDAFTDRHEVGKRLLLRLWIEAHHPRPVRPETFLYPGGAGIPAQPGRQPSFATDVEII